MNARTTSWALGAVVIAVLVQTTFFSSVRPFGVAPDLVLLVTVATARRLPVEQALLTGFTAGLLTDLLGSAPLGLHAMSLVVVAFLVVRFRDRLEAHVPTTAVGVAVLTLVGMGLVITVGTLFGEDPVADVSLLRRMALMPVYNLILAALVLPAVNRLLEARRGRRWVP